MNKMLLTTALLGSMAIAGMTYAADAPAPAAPSTRTPQHHKRLDDALAKFKPADADMVRSAMKATHDKNQALADKLDDLHNKRHTIATADKFDQAAYNSTSASIEKTEDELHSNIDKSMAGILAKLPVDERKELAETWGPMRHHNHATAATTTSKK